MGQKIHPYGFRLGVTKDWISRWFSTKDYANLVQEDRLIRKMLKKKHYNAGVVGINIDRKANQIELTIHTAKPGIIVGRGGTGIEATRADLFRLTGKKVQLNVQEVKNVEAEAQLIAESVCQQLEKRIAFRRAMKQAIMRAMKAGAKGIKIMVAGRLGGAEIARTEWLREGRIPLQTLRADLDYGTWEARTMMGVIGVKVWVYKGDIMPEAPKVKQERQSGANAKRSEANVDAQAD
ncbi:MAG: 30S ribosomal protein S3 [Candidatus Sericytochromatia bacterium]|nr:30S ribosomal protein S3 [Candidatus Sericytochromatia bacterium]